MQRIFTRQVGKNFERGRIMDLAMDQWHHIARSVGLPLESFSKPVETVLHESISQGSRKKSAEV